MGIARLPLVVIDQIYIMHFAILETERYPPIGAYGHRPKPLKLAGQRMKPEAREVYVFDLLRAIEQAEDVFDSFGMLGVDAPAAATFE
jgi:uncharacterized protein related to proFAR isomerase